MVSWGQLSQLCPLPTPCALPACSLVGWGERQKRPWLCVSPAQQYRKHPCVINTVFSTNPKHSPTPATVKKTNSIPAKTSAGGSWGADPTLLSPTTHGKILQKETQSNMRKGRKKKSFPESSQGKTFPLQQLRYIEIKRNESNENAKQAESL